MGIKNNKIFTPFVACVKLFGRRFPEALVKIRYFVRFKKFLNLKNPQTLNEKILYMSLRTDTSLWTRLADKYNVRGYVEECGLSDILVPLYGYWTDASDIDFNALPNSFVLKSVQGSGDVILVKDKMRIDVNNIKKRIQKAIDTKYGELEGGIHYMRIQPGAIAEELLKNDDTSLKYSSSIIDYKIWCFNGKPHFINVYGNRVDDVVEFMPYDLNWNPHPEYTIPNNKFKIASIIPKPRNFDKMLAIAEKLAKPFPVVRVDLYNLDGKIYFGEMTFTSRGGLMDNLTEQFQNYAGRMIDINYRG